MSLATQVAPPGAPPSPFYTEEHEAFRNTVRRFVEQQRARVAEHRGGDAEALLHAE